MADLRKLKDEASQAFTKQKWGKAVELYDELVKADPRDLQAQMKLGDALVKNAKKERALGIYQKVAESYASEGFLPKAIAVCKVILELDPKHSATQQVLASLYAKKMGADVPMSSGAKRPTTSAQASRPVAPASTPVAPARPPSAAIVPPPPAEVLAEAADDGAVPIELDTGDHGRGGFQTSAAQPQGNEVELPPELDPSLYAQPSAEAPPPAPPQQQVAAPPAPKPPPEPALVAPRPVAPPPEPAQIPSEIEHPLELEIELSPSTLQKAGLLQPEPAAPPPAATRPPTRPAPSLDWGAKAAEPDSIEAQLESAAEHQPETPLAPAASAAGEDSASIEIAFDVPMADSAEEEIEVLSVTAEVKNNLGRELPKIPLFSDLAPEAFVELTEQCGFIRAEPGQTIIREGEGGNSFFVVCSGKMKVTKQSDGEEMLMAYLAEGAFFGEMALLSGAKRAATVTAEDESELLEISAPILNGLAKRYPHVAQSLRQFGRQRLLANVMATSALFRPFDKSDRKRLVELFKVREVQANEVVVAEGRPTDGLYLLMSGEVEVSKGGKPLASLTDGDIFGELSLLSKKPASATVSARRRSTVLRLPRERFEELIVTYPQVLVLLSDLADQRTRADAMRRATLPADHANPLV